MNTSTTHAYTITNATNTFAVTVFAKTMSEATDLAFTLVRKNTALYTKMAR